MSDELEMKAPWPLKIKGVIGFLCGIILLLLFGMYRLVHFSLDQWGVPINLNERFSAHESAITLQHKAVEDAVTSLTYVMALPQKEREQLAAKMKMPESLRRQLRSGE